LPGRCIPGCPSGIRLRASRLPIKIHDHPLPPGTKTRHDGWEGSVHFWQPAPTGAPPETTDPHP
jgi:hypothetical protein